MIAGKRGVVRVSGALGAVVALVVGGGSGVAAAASAGPANLVFSPSPYSFGSVVVGNTASNSFTLANTGGRTARAVTATLVGSAEFTITANSCTAVSLRPSASCTVSVQFAPTSAGTASATLRAVDRKGAVLATDALTGTGPTGQHLYWTNYGSGTVMRANLDGTGVTTLVSGRTNHLYGLAADASHIYWIEADAVGNGTVMRANLDGTGMTTLASGQSAPIGIAVDANYVYWANGDSTIMRANLDGTGVSIWRNTGPGVIPQWVAVDANHVYWTADFNYIEEDNLDGSPVNQYAAGRTEDPYALAVSPQYVYFSNPGNQTIELDGLNLLGPGVPVVTGVPFVSGLAVDANHVYYANRGNGEIDQTGLTGGFSTTLVTAQNGPLGLALGP
jgi:hypothetical protein